MTAAGSSSRARRPTSSAPAPHSPASTSRPTSAPDLGHTRRRMRRAAASLLAALVWVLAGPVTVAHAQGVTAVSAADEAVLRAYVAAWNGGDAARVASLFSPTAEIRQRAPWLEDGGDRAFIRDSYGAEMTLYFSALTFSGSDILWARGRSDVALWAAQHMRDGHRLEIDGVQAD